MNQSIHNHHEDSNNGCIKVLEFCKHKFESNLNILKDIQSHLQQQQQQEQQNPTTTIQRQTTTKYEQTRLDAIQNAHQILNKRKVSYNLFLQSVIKNRDQHHHHHHQLQPKNDNYDNGGSYEHSNATSSLEKYLVDFDRNTNNTISSSIINQFISFIDKVEIIDNHLNTTPSIQSQESSYDCCTYDNTHPLSSHEFKKRYIHQNIPALITNLKFSPVTELWTHHHYDNDDDNDNDKRTNMKKEIKLRSRKINSQWFLNTIGEHTLVPIRIPPQILTSSPLRNIESLDDDGRAMECTTVHMTLKEWIDQRSDRKRNTPTGNTLIFTKDCIDFHDNHNDSNDTTTQTAITNINTTKSRNDYYYLKDWHLQSILRREYEIGNSIHPYKVQLQPLQHPDNTHDIHRHIVPNNTISSPMNHTCNIDNLTTSDVHTTLYTVPQIFANDLLHNFIHHYNHLNNHIGDENYSYIMEDYQFVYWGRKGSYTPMHSDVCNTFSWSYNVVGKKLWIFYLPKPEMSSSSSSVVTAQPTTKDGNTTNTTTKPHPTPIFQNNHHGNNDHDDDHDNNNYYSLTIIQNAGETIFVPSGWKHTVINIHGIDNDDNDNDDTISINHNWISSVALDQMWDCIMNEIQAIRHELQSWNMMETTSSDGRGVVMCTCSNSNSSCEKLEWGFIQENMLKGCVGLDVTTFCFMILLGILDVIDKLQVLLIPSSSSSSSSSSNNCVSVNTTILQHKNDVNNVHNETPEECNIILLESYWELWFDLTCMGNMLHVILSESKNDNTTNDMILLDSRLGARLGSHDAAMETIEIMTTLQQYLLDTNIIIDQ